MNEEDLADRADAALIGVVTSIEVDSSGGSIRTYVSIEADAVLFGDLAADEIVLEELGGEVSGRREHVFGVPGYSVGERVLVFVSEGADGTLRTLAMAMGKYRLSAAADASIVATRTFDEGSMVLDPQSGALVASLRGEGLDDLLARIEKVRPIDLPADFDWGMNDVIEQTDEFTYLGKPARWFEPDDGLPVEFLVCPPERNSSYYVQAIQAVEEAFAAWSDDPLSTLELTEEALGDPLPFEGCSGPNRIVFDDPFEEIDDPHDCVGIVAIGGYCAVDHETRAINGQTFRRILIGRVTFGNGWSSCPFWNACNMAEVATHEMGHAIGLGHSMAKDATMAPMAHLDGRCGGLADDDRAGLRSLYPRDVSSLPTPTRTATHRPSPTERTTPSATPLPSKRPTRTPRSQSTPLHNENGATPTPTPREPTVGVAETPPPTQTPAQEGICMGDANGDHAVSIDEVIAVLLNSLEGCAPNEH